jgi:rhomboid protease GluP
VNEPQIAQPQPVSYRLPLSRPIVTWILLAIILVVFAIETVAGGSTDVEVLVRLGAKVTPLIAAGEYWRLLTSMFLHIGIMHLAFNAYALVVLGTELERLYGPGRFLAIYLISGLFGSLASYAFSYSLAAGASGAVFGLIGALAAFFLVHRERLGAYGRTRLANIAFLVAVNLFFGFTQTGIDNLAHMGGLLAGLALGWALVPKYQLDPVRPEIVDSNQLQRYWPALALAAVLFLGGTALATVFHQDSARSHLFRGYQAVEREAWDEVAAEFEQVLDADPDLADVSTYFNLGLAYNYLGDLEKATEAYEAALELDARHGPTIWNLALTYLDLQQYTRSRSLFETYRELKPAETLDVQPYLDELDRLQP